MHLGAARVKEVRAQALKWELEGYRMKDGDSIDDFIGKITITVNQLRTLGEEVEEGYVVKKILRAVSPKFIQIASTLEEFGDISNKTIEEITGSLKAHEERMRSIETTDISLALLSKSDSKPLTTVRGNERHSRPTESYRGREIWRGGRQNRGYVRGQGNRGRFAGGDRFRTPDKSRIRCYNCQRFGHFAYECDGDGRDDEVHYGEEEEDEPALLIAEVCESDEEYGLLMAETCATSNPSEQVNKNKDLTSESTWYYDSGASNHMTGDRKLLSNFNDSASGNIRLGDGSHVHIEGQGNAIFKCRDGGHMTLLDVYYIPKLKNNIISLGQLDENGAKIVLQEGNLRVYDRDGTLIAKIPKKKNRLYTTAMSHTHPICLMASLKEESWLWHARFGHLNFRSLNKLAKDRLVKGLPLIEQPNRVCDGCMVGKQSRYPFPKHSDYRAEKHLNLVHGDLCGPISPPTIGGKLYFLLLVDDYSRFMWISFLKSKTEAFGAFKKLKVAAETESNEKLKVLRTDRGGEFTSTEFTKYCEEHGIKRQLTAPYSPQQNGVVERRNRTIIEMARCLLKSKRVPAEYWGEAVQTVIYILNRSFSRSLEGSTPYQAWYGRVPNIHHFRIFGSIVYVKKVRPHLKKLADRSVKVVFLGYESGSKAYRFVHRR